MAGPGACWAFVAAKFQQFMFGSYPVDERWRVISDGVMFVVLLVPLMIPKVPYKALNAVVFFWFSRSSPSSCWSAAGSACR